MELSCPICGSLINNIHKLYEINSNIDGYFEKAYTLYCCPSCGAGITHPRPTNSSLEQHYKTGLYAKSGGRGMGLINFIYNGLQDIRIKEFERYCSSTGKLLDVGCGKGRFLSRAARRNWCVQGVESSSSQADFAKERYQLNVFSGDLLEANFDESHFDVITTWHVLEHLPNPKQYLNETHRILKPNGLLVLEVPNFNSLQAKIGQNKWFQLDVPRHLIHYKIRTLEYLLSNYGFTLLEYKTISFDLGPFGMLQSIINRLGVPPNWLFRWLKRSVDEKEIKSLLISLFYGLTISTPALLLEMFSSLINRGGVIRVIARKDE